MYHPRGVVFDSNGNLYVSTENGFIRKIDTSGKISTIAGNPNGAFFDEAKALDMYLSRPYGLTLDEEKNYLYVADTGNNRIVRIDLNTKMAKSIAGNNLCQTDTTTAEYGSALSASLCNPEFVSLDLAKNLIIADTGHSKIRRVIFSDSTNGLLKYEPMAEDNSTLQRNTDGTFLRTFRNGTKISYDSAGKHIYTQDKVGRIITNQYDEAGNLIFQIDPIGSSIEYSYSGNKLTAISYSGDNREFNLNYNATGDLISVTYPDGSTKEYGYDANGLLTTETDQRNNSTQYVYNEYKRLYQVIRPDNNRITMNDAQSLSMINNYTGGTTGQFKKYGTNPSDLADGIKDAKNISTTFLKDESGYVSTIIDGLNRTTLVERDLKGRPTKITRPDESYVTFTYDKNTGDLLSKFDSHSNASETFSYDIFGNLLSHTDSQGRKVTNEYNSKGLITRTINETLGTTIQYAYNNLGLLLSMTDSLGQVAQLTYNPQGNIESAIDPSYKQTNYSYFNTGFIYQVQDQNLNVTTYEYSNMNRLTSVTTPKNEKTEYEYLQTGELSKIIDPNLNETLFYYDNLGQLIRKVGTKGEQTLLTYDPNGNIASEINPIGQAKTFEYDNLDQLTRKVLPDNIYNYSYDVRGNVINVSNNLSQVELNYEHFDKGDLISSIRSFGMGTRTDLPDTTINYSYNDAGEKVQTQTPYGVFHYERDAVGRLKKIINHKNEEFDLSYDLNNRIKSISSPAMNSSYTYDNIGFNSGIYHNRKSGATIERFIFSRDDVGNRTSIQTLEGTSQFSYDQNNQLVNAIVPNLPQESFSYDSIGNQIQNNQVYDLSKQLLIEDNNFIYEYDGLGNLISRQEKAYSGNVQNFTYDSENKLRIFKLYKNNNLETEAHYTYDALGRRIEKVIIDHIANTSKTKRYVYDGEEIVAELNYNNETQKIYTHSTLRIDEVLALDTKNHSYFYVRNHLNSITDITDSLGFKIQSYHFSAYGKLLKITNANGVDITNNPIVDQSFAFTNREIDFESNLYNYRARMYNGEGRFIQPDIAPGKINNPTTFNSKYNYASNSPAVYTDPNGKTAKISTGNTVSVSYNISKGTDVRIHPIYGDYCGPYSNDGVNFDQPAKDGPDSVCKEHDQNYASSEQYQSKYWDSGSFIAPEMAVIAETSHYFYHRLLADGELIVEMFNHNSWRNKQGHHDIAQFGAAMGLATFFTLKYYYMGTEGFKSSDYILFSIDKQSMLSKYLKKSIKRIGL